MILRPILTVDADLATLKRKSDPVTVVDDDLRALMDDMLETMYAAPGIGLAAIQVGVPKRVIVMDISRGEEPQRQTGNTRDCNRQRVHVPTLPNHREGGR